MLTQSDGSTFQLLRSSLNWLSEHFITGLFTRVSLIPGGFVMIPWSSVPLRDRKLGRHSFPQLIHVAFFAVLSCILFSITGMRWIGWWSLGSWGVNRRRPPLWPFWWRVKSKTWNERYFHNNQNNRSIKQSKKLLAMSAFELRAKYEAIPIIKNIQPSGNPFLNRPDYFTCPHYPGILCIIFNGADNIHIGFLEGPILAGILSAMAINSSLYRYWSGRPSTAL